MVIKRKNPFLTKRQLSNEIAKRKEAVRNLERLEKLHKNFKLGKPSTTRLTRSQVSNRMKSSKNISAEASKRIKIFKIKNPSGRGNLFIPAIPKGTKLRPRKRK